MKDDDEQDEEKEDEEEVNASEAESGNFALLTK